MTYAKFNNCITKEEQQSQVDEWGLLMQGLHTDQRTHNMSTNSTNYIHKKMTIN